MVKSPVAIWSTELTASVRQPRVNTMCLHFTVQCATVCSTHSARQNSAKPASAKHSSRIPWLYKADTLTVFCDQGCNTTYFNRCKNHCLDLHPEAQLSLGWGRPYWLSLTLKVIQGRWFLCHLKERIPLQPIYMPYLAPFSQNTSVTAGRQTDKQMTTTTKGRP